MKPCASGELATEYESGDRVVASRAPVMSLQMSRVNNAVIFSGFQPLDRKTKDEIGCYSVI